MEKEDRSGRDEECGDVGSLPCGAPLAPFLESGADAGAGPTARTAGRRPSPTAPAAPALAPARWPPRCAPLRTRSPTWWWGTAGRAGGRGIAVSATAWARSGAPVPESADQVRAAMRACDRRRFGLAVRRVDVDVVGVIDA